MIQTGRNWAHCTEPATARAMILYNMTKKKTSEVKRIIITLFLSKRGYLTTTPRLHAMMCGPGETSRTVAVRTVRGGGGHRECPY